MNVDCQQMVCVCACVRACVRECVCVCVCELCASVCVSAGSQISVGTKCETLHKHKAASV